MLKKVSQEELLYLRTEHLAGELSVLMSQIKRVQKLQMSIPLLSQVELLILSTHLLTLFLVENLKKRSIPNK